MLTIITGLLMMCTTIQSQHPAERLPERFQSYRMSERLNYTPDNLYEYINGAAEMYLSYGLKGMYGCRYTAENLPDVTVDIYEMAGSRDAFGVYTQSRDRDEYTYGQGSLSYPEATLFWKDRYFVVISADRATPESTAAIGFLADAADKAIHRKGKIPGIVGLLPAEKPVDGGILYFHHYIWLNAYFFIADFDLLNINEQTDAVVAKYGTPEQRSYLLLVEYPDENATVAAYRRLMQRYAPESGNGQSIRLEDGTWFAGWHGGKRLCAIFNSPSLKEAESLLQATISKMQF
ncbi:MAG: hypothetical protein LBF89_11205 [Bacteroidales bacterium]|jgi:hypothetical protein|nr:hypothetical protein [Bacteroidales bacterium]